MDKYSKFLVQAKKATLALVEMSEISKNNKWQLTNEEVKKIIGDLFVLVNVLKKEKNND